MRRKPAADAPRTSTARPKAMGGVVKSAGRVLEVLEFFDDVQRAASVVEVAETLGYPQSSASVLLRSLVTLGYLSYDRIDRTYIPTSRVALLGHWINQDVFRDGAILGAMKDLNRQTGDAVVLAVRNGLNAQYIHVVQATSRARLHLTLGTVRPLVASGTGLALICNLPEADVTRLVTRTNAEAGLKLRVKDVLAALAEVRRQGYAVSMNSVTPGGGVIAMPVPSRSGQSKVVIGVAGISEVMQGRKEQLVKLLREAIQTHLSARG